jgi:hypothetical protein
MGGGLNGDAAKKLRVGYGLIARMRVFWNLSDGVIRLGGNLLRLVSIPMKKIFNRCMLVTALYHKISISRVTALVQCRAESKSFSDSFYP